MTADTIHVDVAILGAGTAGLGARRAAKKERASVLMIDPGPLGTTCARVGCMPSKLLIAAADAAHHAHTAPMFGVHPGDVRVDGAAVLERLRFERDRFVGFVTETIDEADGMGELLRERARVVGPGRLVAGRKTVHFRSLVVAVGGAPFVPPPYRDLGDALLTTDGVFELADLPDSLLVVGLGVIGLELGQAFHRLGVRTTLLGRGGSVGPLRDPKVAASAEAVLGAALDLHPEHELGSVERTDRGVRVVFVDSAGVERDEVFERVLVAAGRRSNLAELGLESLGVATDGGRFPIDPDTLQLADLPVFVAGDANGLHPLLHEAADDGKLAGANAGRHPDIRAARRRTPLSIVFTDPQMGIVGDGFRGLTGRDASAGEVDFTGQGRSRVMGVNAGMLRVYGDQHSGRLLGAEMFGPRAEHIAHLLAWAVQEGLTVERALEMPFYHPVIEEGLRTALRDLAASLRHRSPVDCRVSELGVGS